MNQGLGSMMPIGQSKAKLYVEKNTKTGFADVDEAKEELQEVVAFLKDPMTYDSARIFRKGFCWWDCPARA